MECISNVMLSVHITRPFQLISLRSSNQKALSMAQLQFNIQLFNTFTVTQELQDKITNWKQINNTKKSV